MNLGLEDEICLVDYKSGGNIFSVLNSLRSLGAKVFISSDKEEILKARSLVVPGVGSFQAAMDNLKELDLIYVLKNKALSKETPFLGICLGMQMLFQSSTESKDGSKYPGLSLVEGEVEKFDFSTSNNLQGTKLKIPHMGWNEVRVGDLEQNPLFKDIENDSDFYFVHSYRAALKKNENNFASTNYQENFISAISLPEIKLFGCQFHPEKSGEVGLKFLKNFIELIR